MTTDANTTASGLVASGDWLAILRSAADIERANEPTRFDVLAKAVAEIERGRELLRDVLAGSVDARTYPDGPSLDRELRNEIKVFLANVKDEQRPTTAP